MKRLGETKTSPSQRRAVTSAPEVGAEGSVVGFCMEVRIFFVWVCEGAGGVLSHSRP